MVIYILTPIPSLLRKEGRSPYANSDKFLRQHPIVYNPYGSGLKYFVADFYCDSKKTVIELDGPIHESNLEYDQFRATEMVNLGLHILRIKNEELLRIQIMGTPLFTGLSVKK